MIKTTIGHQAAYRLTQEDLEKVKSEGIEAVPLAELAYKENWNLNIVCGWHESTLDYVRAIGELLGIDVDTEQTFFDLEPEYSGIAMDTEYQSKKHIHLETLPDDEVKRIAKHLNRVAEKYEYDIVAATEAKENSTGVYTKVQFVEMDWPAYDYDTPLVEDSAADITEVGAALLSFADWALEQLRRRYEELITPEAVIKCIVESGLYLTASGEIF